ncbi:hypothetical protein F4811DRAFT_534423 [Daldinia bambusicola]|nr:hypothetical protein F4811DRAFT_534423 [Daldinia bambusicola]
MCPCGAACRCNPCRCGSRRSGSTRSGNRRSGRRPTQNQGISCSCGQYMANTSFHDPSLVLDYTDDEYSMGYDFDPADIRQAIRTPAPIPEDYRDLALAGLRARSGGRDSASNRGPRVGETPGQTTVVRMMDQLDNWKRSALTTHDGAPRPLNNYLFPDSNMRELFGEDYTRYTPDEYMRCLDQAVDMVLEQTTEGPQGSSRRN